MITLIASSVRFYSSLDESIFFYSLKNNNLVSSFRGDGNKIIIECANEKPSTEEFLSIYALFKRYRINLRQIKSLVDILDINDRKYICNKDMIWYKDIFGS
jgi:hypothetical protein